MVAAWRKKAMRENVAAPHPDTIRLLAKYGREISTSGVRLRQQTPFVTSARLRRTQIQGKKRKWA
ncbi:MAG TPA: hypothetical protein VHM90_09215 [Phycisphaerae bacterium]|nr:hypothetical protein [Phycisphaerae bacterium]